MERITSLENFGYRTLGDFTEDAVRKTRDAGFSAVFINGGSGFGVDSFFIESMLQTRTLPDLMPYTTEYIRREMHRRIGLLVKYGLKPYICVWDTIGTHSSGSSQERYLDRRTKLELHAKQRRNSELFGTMYTWRANQPLCISHPLVQQFYQELFLKLPQEYPELAGIFYFPGDFALAVCSDRCERCKATGLTQHERMINHVNRIRDTLNQTELGRKIRLYYGFWNIEQPGAKPAQSPEVIDFTLSRLNTEIGAAITINDNIDIVRRNCPMTYIQPWGTFTERGPFFMHTAELCRKQGRSLMAFSEITQAEQFDPVCVNMPFALKTLNLYRNLAKTPEVDAVVDFWGARPPYYMDACHAIQNCYLENPEHTDIQIINDAAARHYGTEYSAALTALAVDAWKEFDQVIDQEALCGWASRFSFAIGRCRARGSFFAPMIPPFLRGFLSKWGALQILMNVTPDVYFSKRKEDAAAYQACAKTFRKLAERLTGTGAENARREADQMDLYGILCVSMGRFLFAAQLYQEMRFDELKREIEAEILHRQDILNLSVALQPFSGVNTCHVEEDIMNMALYLSDDTYPDTPDELFSLTPVPMTI